MLVCLVFLVYSVFLVRDQYGKQGHMQAACRTGDRKTDRTDETDQTD